MKCTARLRTLVLSVATGLGLALVPFESAHAQKCTWTVSGQLVVETELDALQNRYGTYADLAGVQVRVSGRRKVLGKWANFASWGTVVTDEDGEFRFRRRKSCGQRQLRLRVRFEDDDLEIRHAQSTSATTKVRWYTVTGNTTRSAGRWNVGTLRFRRGGQGGLGRFEAIRHAQIWVVYQDAIRWLRSQGGGYGFTTKVKVKYPHDGDLAPEQREASYVNPTTKVIYIVRNSQRDQFATETLLHELGHVWAYNHSRGESCLTMALIATGNTHGRVEEPCVAFHEGFAEYFGERMMKSLWYEPANWRMKPFSRTYLKTGGHWGTPLTELADYVRSDVGWRSFLHMLGMGYLKRYTLDPGLSSIDHNDPRTWVIQLSGTMPTARCHTPGRLLTFKQVLRTFEPGGSASGRLSKADMSIFHFLLRASRVHSHLNRQDRRAYRTLANPASSRQPSQLIRCR